MQVGSPLPQHLLCDRLELLPHLPQLLAGRRERDHDLHDRVASRGHAVAGRFHDRAHLHRVETGLHDPETQSPEPQHRIVLVQLLDLAEDLPRLVEWDLLVANHHFVLVPFFGHRYSHREINLIGQELVQGRVEQPDRHGQAVHGLEDADEVVPLERRQRVVGLLFLIGRLGEDHLANGSHPLLAQEHVLGPAQADAFGSVRPGVGCLVERVRVRPNTEAPSGIRGLHVCLERLPDLLLTRFEVAVDRLLEGRWLER